MTSITPNSRKFNVPIDQWAERLFIVLLFAFPKLNLKIGPLPIYFIDVVVFYIWFKHRQKQFSKLNWISIGLFGFFILHQLIFVAVTKDIGSVMYLTVRHGLPLLAIPVFPYVLINLKSKKTQLALILSAIFTSFTSVFSSLPATRGIVENIISFPFLYPSIERQFEKKGTADQAIRSLSIIGVSNVTGVLILMAVVLLLYINSQNNKIRHLIWIIIILIAGAITTYSRTVSIAIILVIFVFFLKYNGNRILKITLMSGLSIIAIFWNQLVEKTHLFNFQRLENSIFKPDDESENFNHGKSERLDSYFKPFETLFNKPVYFFMGETINITKSSEEIGFVRLKFNPPDHSLFGRAFYMNGFIVSVLYLYILIFMIYKTFSDLTIGLVIIPVIIWSFFAHGMISSPNGAYMFFLIFAFAKYPFILERKVLSKPEVISNIQESKND